MINGYGPTESTTFTTCYTIPPGVDASWSNIPIGRPIAGRSVYVLNEAMQPVPAGVPGELYIGGRGLARGYLNRPELNQEKFIADPFSERPGGRLYRSGDLCRWREDGVLEFLGRRDQQVKLRGHRIELEEVESVMLDAAEVGQCAVVVREFGENDRRLVAFVVASANQRVDEERLLSLLRRRLPDYMVPSLIVVLPSLPLTSSGKICRRSLQSLELRSQTHLDKESVAPRTETEGRLVAIWEELLGRKVPGIHANFFALGGHSLLALRLCSRIVSRLGVQLRVREVFEHPTIAELGLWIDSSNAKTSPGHLLKPIDRKLMSRIPLSFAQQRLWIIDQLQGSIHYHVCSAWRVRGALDCAALHRALDKLIQRHESLRTCFRSDDDGLWQAIQQPRPADLRFFDLLDSKQYPSAADVRQLREEFELAPFDLNADQMLRALVLRTAETEYIFEMCLHHIACDGWSLPLLTSELSAEYEAEVRSTNSNLSALPVQYADYAVWQRNKLHADRHQALSAFWKSHLEGMAPGAFPTDAPRPKQPSIRGAEQPVRLESSLIRDLESLARSNGSTLYMTLLAALNSLINRFSGQVDVSIGSPIASRDAMELERLIGFFVNLVVVRCQVSGDQTFRELLAEVREKSIAAYDHSDLPFDRLVQEIQRTNNSLEMPLVHTVFQLLPGPTNRLDLPGLALEPIPQCSLTARFDLEFSLWPEADDLAGVIVYNADLYRTKTIRRIASAFELLLRGIVSNPDRRLCDYDLNSDEVRDEILHERAVCQALNGVAQPHREEETVSPRTDTERRILVLYEELLGRSVPSVHANFFHLGGHSLLAIRLASRIKNAFGCEIPAATVFSHSSVAELATAIQSARESIAQTADSNVRDGHQNIKLIREGAGEVAIVIMGLPGGSFLTQCPPDCSLWFYENPIQTEKSISAAAEDLCREISARLDRKNVILAGYSYAALVAHATAVLLRDSVSLQAKLVLVEPSLRSQWNTQIQKLKEYRLVDLPRRAIRSLLRRFQKLARRQAVRSKIRRGLEVGGTEHYDYHVVPRLMEHIRHHEPRQFAGDALLVYGQSYDQWRVAAWRRHVTGTMRMLVVPEAIDHRYFRDPVQEHAWIQLLRNELMS